MVTRWFAVFEVVKVLHESCSNSLDAGAGSMFCAGRRTRNLLDPKTVETSVFNILIRIRGTVTHSPYLVTLGGIKAEISFKAGKPELQRCERKVDAHEGSSVGDSRNI
jgi:hypothetical protein